MGEKLALEIIKNRTDLAEIKETMATKEDVNKILGVVDAFAQRIETYDRKTILHDARLSDHEARITRLERPA